MELSYCVVNTNGRDFLLACLRSIRRTHPEGAGTVPWTKRLVTSSTSAPARASAAQSERSYGGV